MTPSAVSRSSAALASIPSNRATGTPRSVTTTSCPSRTRCSHSLRFARRSLMATSTPKVYRRCLTETYAVSMAPAWSAFAGYRSVWPYVQGKSSAAGLRAEGYDAPARRFEALRLRSASKGLSGSRRSRGFSARPVMSSRSTTSSCRCRA